MLPLVLGIWLVFVLGVGAWVAQLSRRRRHERELRRMVARLRAAA